MSEMHLTVHGRLVNNPQLRTTKSRRPFTTFRVATNGRHPVPGNPGTYEDGPTSYLAVTAFGDLGANAFRSLSQGQPVVLTGVLRVREFQREDGSPGMSADVRATSVGHDLTWGTTDFTKVRRGTYGDGDPLDQPEVAQALGEMYEHGLAERERAAGGGDDDAYEVLPGPDDIDAFEVDAATGELTFAQPAG